MLKQAEEVALPEVRVLFVGLGNICRSPMAQAIFARLVEEAGLAERFHIDSVATSGWHVGSLQNYWTQQTLYKNGYGTFRHRARQITAEEYFEPDTHIVAMDYAIVSQLRERFGRRDDVQLLLDFWEDDRVLEVPDPYNRGGYTGVFLLIEKGCQGLFSLLAQWYDLDLSRLQ